MKALFSGAWQTNDFLRECLPLNDDALGLIINVAWKEKIPAGHTVFQQGDVTPNFLYIVEAGMIEISKSVPDGNNKFMVGAGGSFGESALLLSSQRDATVKALQDSHVWIVEKSRFQGALKTWAGPDTCPKIEGVSRRTDQITKIQKLVLLGCGTFGAVWLAQATHNGTSCMRALKVVSKGMVVQAGAQTMILNERHCQLMADSPFVIKLFAAINAKQSFYFIHELALGGDLKCCYEMCNFVGELRHARFYTAGVVLALQHLHGLQIMHRDIKPQNIMLNADGRVKLSDFGFAKVVRGKTFTLCGTPYYLAPEVISLSGYSHPADWWILGILTFVLLSGRQPFEAQSPADLFWQISRAAFTFPPTFCSAETSFIAGLCAKRPCERLPVKVGGAENIKTHPFFDGFDWDAYVLGKMEPPYKPQVRSERNFEQLRRKQQDVASNGSVQR